MLDAELLDPPTRVPGRRLYAAADFRRPVHVFYRAACVLFLSLHCLQAFCGNMYA